jgi:hypothetical protein
MVRNPESWRLPYEIVKVYTLNRRDEPESIAVAPYYLRMVAERHEHPELYLNWARQIQEREDLAGQSRAIWEDVIRTADDPFVREMAQKNLGILIAGDTEKVLQQLSDRYQTAYGRAPVRLEDFVQAGWIDVVPDEETYGRFVIDGDGTVISLRVCEDRLERMLMAINTRLRLESEDRGRTPRDYDECVEWLGGELSPCPVPGRTWTYNPETGEMS